MNRVLLKLSGEALAGDKKTGFDEDTCVAVAKQVKTIVDKGVQVAIVIGGGNFWRGRTSNKIDRTKADGIGMMATIMNCMYVSEIFRTEEWILMCIHLLHVEHGLSYFQRMRQ